MNTIKHHILFTVSLALNAVLIGVLIAVTLHPPTTTASTAVKGTESPTPTTHTSRVAFSPSALDRAMTSDSAPKNWRDVLQNASPPPHILAAIVKADFEARWQTRQAEIYKKYLAGEVDMSAPTIVNLERDLEEDKELQAAMGEDAFKAWDQARQLADFDLKNQNLSATEMNSLYRLRKGLQQQVRNLEIAVQKKQIDQAFFEQEREKAEADYEQQLKTLLGYERYGAIKGTGLSANERSSFKQMNVTGDQLAALDRIECKWNEQQAALQKNMDLGRLDIATFDEQTEVFQEWRNQELQLIVGTDAFDAYQKQQDWRYEQMKTYSTQWGINEEDIELIYKVLNAYEKTAQGCRQQIASFERQGDPSKQYAVSHYLQQLPSQTTGILLDYLGPERFNLLKRNEVFQPN